jgi:hypothetical protein
MRPVSITPFFRGFPRLPGQSVFDHEKRQIAAASRAPGTLDLFVIGFVNHVWSEFWNLIKVAGTEQPSATTFTSL